MHSTVFILLVVKWIKNNFRLMLQLCICTIELGVGLDKGIFNDRDTIGNVWLAL